LAALRLLCQADTRQPLRKKYFRRMGDLPFHSRLYSCAAFVSLEAENMAEPRYV
jgi:hypothetical protein